MWDDFFQSYDATDGHWWNKYYNIDECLCFVIPAIIAFGSLVSGMYFCSLQGK